MASILNDTALFNGSADLTTKEILKRYGAIAKSVSESQPVTHDVDLPSSRVGNNNGGGGGGGGGAGGGRDGRGILPIVTRVDTDPYQATAWEKESSVRHVQGSSPHVHRSSTTTTAATTTTTNTTTTTTAAAAAATTAATMATST